MTDWPRLHSQHTAGRTKHIRDLNLLSDVTVRVQGVQFPCHRFFLAANSDYFLNIFTTQSYGRQKDGEIVDAENTQELDFRPEETVALTSSENCPPPGIGPGTQACIPVSERPECDIFYASNTQVHSLEQVADERSPFLTSGICPEVLPAGTEECKDNPDTAVVDIDFTTPEVFGIILDSLYSEQDPVTDTNVVALLKTADRLQIPSLVQHCVNSILDLLLKGRIKAMDLIMDPDLIYNTKIARAALDVLLIDFGPEVCKTEWFLGLSHQSLMTVLDDHRLNVRDEDEVYRALTEWYEHDPGSRKQFLEEITDKIRLVNLSRRVLAEKVLRHWFSSRGEEREEGGGGGGVLFQHVQRALAYHLLPDRRHSEALRHGDFRPSQAQERVVLVMGDGSARLFAFSMARQSWFKLAGPPKPLGLGIAACSHGDDVYVTGGDKAMTSSWRYRPRTNSWKQLPDLCEGRRSHACVAVGDAVYVLGGKDDRKPMENDSLASVEIFQVHCKSEGWRDVGVSLPVPIRSMAAGVVGEKIYLIGGRTNGFQRTLSVIQCVDTVSLQSFVVSHLPNPSVLARPLYANNVLYILDTNGDVMRFVPEESKPCVTPEASAGSNQLNEPPGIKPLVQASTVTVNRAGSQQLDDSKIATDSQTYTKGFQADCTNDTNKAVKTGSTDSPTDSVVSCQAKDDPDVADKSRQNPEKGARPGDNATPDASSHGVFSQLYSSKQGGFVKVGSIKNLNWKWYGAARNHDGTVYVISGDLPRKVTIPTLSVESSEDESVLKQVKFIRPEQMGMCYMDVHACIPKSFLLEKVV